MNAERNRLVDALDSLPAAVRTVRSTRGLSLRAAAEEMGISFNTLTRLEKGEEVVVSNARAALLWVANPGAVRDER
jgi:transcriptional regulator with XRE-family HTH domain